MKLAGVSSEEELIRMFGEHVSRMQDQTEGMFFGAPEYEEFDSEIVWDQDSTMKQKTASVRRFFEYSYSYDEGAGDGVDDEDEWGDWDDEEKSSGMIDAEWCDNWPVMLGLCHKASLMDTLKKLGGETGSKKKEELAKEVHGILSRSPGRLKDILSEEERTLLKKLRSMINKEEYFYTDEFPFPEQLIASLLEKGIVDIRTGHNAYNSFLTVFLPRRLKGVHL